MSPLPGYNPRISISLFHHARPLQLILIHVANVYFQHNLENMLFCQLKGSFLDSVPYMKDLGVIVIVKANLAKSENDNGLLSLV